MKANAGKMSIIFLAIVSVPMLIALFLVAPLTSFDETDTSPKQYATMQDVKIPEHKTLQLSSLIPVPITLHQTCQRRNSQPPRLYYQ